MEVTSAMSAVLNISDRDWREVHTSTGRASTAIATLLMQLVIRGFLLEDRDHCVDVVLPLPLGLFASGEYCQRINAVLRGPKSVLRVSAVRVEGVTTVVTVAPSVGLGSLCE